MLPKPLIPDEKPKEGESALPPVETPTPRKPFTKRRAQSANEIGGWGNTEIDAGMYRPDEKDTISKAVNEGLKAEKLG